MKKPVIKINDWSSLDCKEESENFDSQVVAFENESEQYSQLTVKPEFKIERFDVWADHGRELVSEPEETGDWVKYSDVALLLDHCRLKEEECKQLAEDAEKLKGKIADMAPVVSQVKQWRDEHGSASKLLKKANADNARLREALSPFAKAYGIQTKYESRKPPIVNEAHWKLVLELLESMK
jgi:hypothetical protein